MNQITQDHQQHGRRIVYTVAAFACLSLGACSWIPKGESGLDVGIKDRGIASWYGAQFHGKQAANGELFDMSALTAAHRTLPLGSIIRVVNLQNGKHVRVRINDRGPYVNGRILDLSYAAAAQLGMVDRGLSVIQLEVIGDHRPEFEMPEWGFPSLKSLGLSVRQPAAMENLPLRLPTVDLPRPAMVPTHRLPPNDVLLQRRWRWEPSVLAEGPSNQDDPTLVLS
jgi:rare lipoprotein A